jgi:hypothetical protein
MPVFSSDLLDLLFSSSGFVNRIYLFPAVAGSLNGISKFGV